MATSKAKPTQEQIVQAVDTLAKWFPEETAELASQREAIVRHILDGTDPAKDSVLLLTNSKKPKALRALAELPKPTPCEEAFAVFLADAVFFAIGLAGLHVSNQERMVRAILRELGPETLRGFARAIHNFSTAEGAYNRATALFTIMVQIYKAGGFRAAFKVLKDEMPWWEWVKTGVIAVAQIIAWVATDGVAFIAEAALTIMSAEQLIEDAVKAVNACK